MSYDAVYISDLHFEHNDGLLPVWLVVRKFIYDIKPKYIILGGDVLDMAPFSPWLTKKQQVSAYEGLNYQEDAELARGELARLRYVCKDSEMIYLEGNHEVWMWNFLKANPQLRQHLDYRKDLKLDDMGIKWLKENDVYSLGKLNYIHGWYWNKWHSEKTLHDMGDNVIYGHTHRPQMVPQKMRPNRTPHLGLCVGCLCNRNPAYRRNRPSDWVNSFAYVEYDTDGTFQPNHIFVINNKIRFGGRVWNA